MNTKNTNKKSIISILFIIMTLASIFGQSIGFVSGAADAEDILIITNLEKTTLIWEVEKSMGVFAQDDIHPNDKYRFYVYTADAVNRKYTVNYTIAPWNTGEWQNEYVFMDSDYRIIKRDWDSFARGVMAVQDAEYWLNTPQLLTKYYIEYSDIMYRGQLINIVTIRIEVDENNYDKAVYTRAEGILLSREIHVDTIKNSEELRGEFMVSLIDYSGNFVLSFWHYVIWFSVIFVSTLIIIVIISILISKRQDKLRNFNY